MHKQKILFVLCAITFLCCVFSAMAIIDTNPSNNKQSVYVDTVDTRDLRVLYVLISNESGDFPSNDVMNTLILNSNRYTTAIYPIADNGLRYYGWSDGPQVKFYVDDINLSKPIADRRMDLLKSLEKLAFGSGIAPERVVGITKEYTLIRLFGGAPGFAPRVASSASVVDASTKEMHLIAHEITHNYGACDEYDLFDWQLFNAQYECINGDVNDNGLLDPSCYEDDDALHINPHSCRAPTFRSLNPFDNKSYEYMSTVDGQNVLRSFMGGVPFGADIAWIDNVTYAYLLDEFSGPLATNQSTTLLIGATLYANGSVKMDNVYSVPQTQLYYANESGNFSFRVKNATNTLFLVNFSPIFMLSGSNDSEETNVSYVVFTIPSYTNITSIEFLYGGVVKDSLSSSVSAPSVTVTAPTGGQTFNGGSFTVNWSATDADGGNLTYLVQVSEDGGVSWVAVSVDLNTTSLTLDTGLFEYGAAYKIRVIASDGVKTGAANNTGVFTIIPPAKLTITQFEEFNEFTQPSSSKTFNITIKNTGGHNLSGVAWQFNTTESLLNSTNNFSLAIGQETNISVSYNYTRLGGSLNVHFVVRNASVNASFESSVYVGSLLMTNFSQTGYSTNRTITFTIVNDGEGNVTGLNWTLDFNDGTANESQTGLNLTLGESKTYTRNHSFSTPGTKQIRLLAGAENLTYSQILNFSIDDEISTAALSVVLISPSASGNVTPNAFSAFTVQACCIQGSCGTVNVTLDPETVERSYAMERRCIGNVCDTSLFSTPRFGFEDNVWKPLEELHSFIGTVPVACVVASDRQHLVDCIDYNATHRKLRISLASGTGTVPLRILDRRGVERSNTNIVFTSRGQESIITVPVGLSDDLHVGATSTNITLLPNTTSIDGWWEVTGDTLAIYNWTNCDENAYSASDKGQISVNSTSSKIYGSAGGTSTQFSACQRIRWDINTTPSNVTAIVAYAYWGGEPHNGSDSQAKALYIGNISSQSWIELDRKSNTFSAQHFATAPNAANAIENVSGHAYVYTLLHMNATKASSSNGAYMEFYYTELRLTTGTSNGSEGPKGTVSNTTGATPFYVNSTNPRQITLSTNECQNVTWWINATGTVNATYTFFAYANLTSNLSISNKTATINLTIVNTSSSSLPQLLQNYTFTSSNEGFTLNTGWIWDSTNGWITYNGTDFGSNLYSANASLKSYTNGYNITIVFTTANITNTKFYFASAGTGTSGDKYNLERNNETTQHFKHDGVGYSATDNYATNTPQTIRISVNVTGNTTKACHVGGSCSNSEGIGSASFGDYVAIAAGTMNGKNRLNITTIEIWRTG